MLLEESLLSIFLDQILHLEHHFLLSFLISAQPVQSQDAIVLQLFEFVNSNATRLNLDAYTVNRQYFFAFCLSIHYTSTGFPESCIFTAQ